MDELEQRLATAHREQLRVWRAALDGGAQRVGWKAAFNLADEPRGLGPSFGHLTSATRIESSDLESIVAANAFHRAFMLAPSVRKLPSKLMVSLAVGGGEVHRPDRAPDPFEAVLSAVARHLATAGEGLLPGDRVITGSLIHVPVAPGDRVEVDMGRLGRLAVAITA